MDIFGNFSFINDIFTRLLQINNFITSVRFILRKYVGREPVILVLPNLNYRELVRENNLEA